MFLGDFQMAGGSISGLKQIVNEKTYNVYECKIKLDDIECVAMIREHVSGMVLLGFKEQDVENKILKCMKNKCDDHIKQLITKRNGWLLFCSILKMAAFGLIAFFGYLLVTDLLAGASVLLLVKNMLGVLIGFFILQIEKNIQIICVNLIPGRIKGLCEK